MDLTPDEPAAPPAETPEKQPDVANVEPTRPPPDEPELTTLDMEFSSGDDVPAF